MSNLSKKLNRLAAVNAEVRERDQNRVGFLEDGIARIEEAIRRFAEDAPRALPLPEGVNPSWDERGVPWCAQTCEFITRDGKCTRPGYPVDLGELCEPAVVVLAAEFAKARAATPIRIRVKAKATDAKTEGGDE